MVSTFELYNRVAQRSHPDGLNEVIEQILDEMVSSFGYKSAFVALTNAKANALEGAFGKNIPSSLLESLSLPLDGHGPLAQSLQLAKVVHVNEAQQDPGLPTLVREFCASAEISFFTAIPILPVSGVLVVSKDAPFSDGELSDLLPTTNRLAICLWETTRDRPTYQSDGRRVSERDWLWFMVNSVPHPAVLSDEQNAILLENVHAERLFKASPDDSEGKRHAIELNSFLFSAALSSFSLDHDDAPGRELTLVDPIEGSELLYEMICRPATNPNTGERGIVAFLENVTDLRRAVVELQRSLSELQQVNDELRYERDRLSLILENVENPIIVAGPSSEIILMNSSAEQLLQAVNESQRSKTTIYSANDAKLTSFLSQFQLEISDVQHGELQLEDPVSSELLSMSITATKAQNQLGQVVAVVCVLQDLTRIKELERRRLEQQLFESEKLAAVGRLAAAVAHEVNNPLESIKNALHLVVSSTPGDDPNRRFLDIAERETQRVSGIIRQMLSFYRPGTTKEPTDINALLEEVITLVQTQFKGNTAWEVSLSNSLPVVVAFPDKLKQVFLNLLLNAREAMDHAGELSIVIRLSRDGDTGFPAGRYVLVEVSDTGGGIAEEHLPQIFDPFFSTKRERQGTGLGLWVSQDIIHQHGGQIKVHSKNGQGSTFIVALPAGGQNG